MKVSDRFDVDDVQGLTELVRSDDGGYRTAVGGVSEDYKHFEEKRISRKNGERTGCCEKRGS